MTSNPSYPTRNYALGAHFVLLRNRAKLTQVELAERLGVHRRTVQKWESGESYPTAERLKALLALLLDLGAFLPGHEQEEGVELWAWVSHDAPQPLPPYDGAWFEQLLAAHSLTSAQGDPPTPGAALLPLVTHQTEANRLPLQATPFVGREAELSKLALLLADPACRLLTLLGPGGIGKSRLALEVVTRHTTLFAQGARFVELGAVNTLQQMIFTMGEHLQLAFGGQEDPVESLLRHLEPLHLLLVLDHIDHLMERVELLSTVVQRAPRITLLVTSRSRLNLRAEWIFDLDGLTYPLDHLLTGAERLSPPDLTRYSALDLFVQQVRHVQPGFSPSADEIQASIRICRQLSGMPLALELAATWARVMPISAIEQQLLTEPVLLTTTLRDMPVHHRNLRVIFDHSWTGLSEPEQTLLARLAVFHGGCTTEAASKVAHASPLLLAALIDKSLLRRATIDTMSPRVDIQRFTMLEPIRDYALQRLTAMGERATTEQAHAEYYLAVAETLGKTTGNGAGKQAFARLEREDQNFRAALQWSLDNKERAMGLRLCAALWRFWQRRGYLHEGRYWLADLMRLPQTEATVSLPDLRTGGGEALAWLASDEHSFVQTVALFEQDMLQAQQGRAQGLTSVLISGARQARSAGDYAQSTTLLNQELVRHRALVDRGELPQATLVPLFQELAMVMREQGDYEHAQALWQECLALQQTADDRIGVAVAQMGLSDIARDCGDSTTVRRWCDQCLPLFRAINEERAIGYCLNNLALAAYLDGDLAQAATLLEEGIAIFQTLLGGPSLGEFLVTRGRIQLGQGKGGPALDDLNRAVRIAWIEGPRWLLAYALEALGEALAQDKAAEQVDRAVQLLSAADQLRRRMGAPVRLADQPALTRTIASAQTRLGTEYFSAVWSAAMELPLAQLLNTLPDIGLLKNAPEL